MANYHYTDNGQQFGPFTLEELRDFHLPPDMLVWYEGMSDWQPVNSLPELQDQFNAPPPPPPVSPQDNPYLKKARRAYNARNVFRIIVAIIFTIIGIVGVAGIIASNEIGAYFLAVIFLGLAIFLFVVRPKKPADPSAAAGTQQGIMMGHMMNMDDMDFSE